MEATGRGITQPRAYLFDHTFVEEDYTIVSCNPEFNHLRKPSAKETYLHMTACSIFFLPFMHTGRLCNISSVALSLLLLAVALLLLS